MRNPLTEGEIAPDFTFKIEGGRILSLSGLRGRKVLLAFFRNGACAMCNLRIRRLIQRYDVWRKQGLEVIAVFESPEASLSRHVGRQEAPFPLVSDPDAGLYKLYGVEVSEEKVKATMADEKTKHFITEAATEGFALVHEEGSNFYRMPAEFLIGKNGIIQQVHYSWLVTDHLPLESIDRFAEANL